MERAHLLHPLQQPHPDLPTGHTGAGPLLPGEMSARRAGFETGIGDLAVGYASSGPLLPGSMRARSAGLERKTWVRLRVMSLLLVTYFF